MSSLSFDEHGSPGYAEYDIVNLGRTGFIQVCLNQRTLTYSCNHLTVDHGQIVSSAIHDLFHRPLITKSD